MKRTKEEFVNVANKFDKVNINGTDIRNNIFRPVTSIKEYKKRFSRIHTLVKVKLVRKSIKILKWFMGKYMVKTIDDIPKEPCNNLPRIFYHSYIKGLEISFKKVIIDFSNKTNGTNYDRDEHWQNWIKNSQSANQRVMLLNLWMTEMMEDTFDRAATEIAMLESYHQLHDLFDGKVPSVDEYRLYDSHEARDIQYFMDIADRKLWGENK